MESVVLNHIPVRVFAWWVTAMAAAMRSTATIAGAGRICAAVIIMAAAATPMLIAATTTMAIRTTATFRRITTAPRITVGRTTPGPLRLPLDGDGVERRGMASME